MINLALHNSQFVLAKTVSRTFSPGEARKTPPNQEGGGVKSGVRGQEPTTKTAHIKQLEVNLVQKMCVYCSAAGE